MEVGADKLYLVRRFSHLEKLTVEPRANPIRDVKNKLVK
jgi:hypothetical protein